jgi:hypothetical protein
MLILIGDLENIIDVSSWAIDKLSDNRHDRFIVRKLLRLMVLKDETGIVLLRQVTPCRPAAFAGMLLAIVLKIRQGVRHTTDPPWHIPHGSFAGIAGLLLLPACC